jgi:hypothetical protein
MDLIMGRIMDSIADTGWLVMTVGDGRSLLCYTVGLTTKGLPELSTTYAPDPQTGHALLNELARRQLDDRAFTAGQVVDSSAGQPLRLESQADLSPLIYVQMLFGNDSPPPTALAITPAEVPAGS